jgi:hypothetical protein
MKPTSSYANRASLPELELGELHNLIEKTTRDGSSDSLLFPGSVTDEDVREAASRGILIFVRQSEAMDDASGSRDLQLEGCLEHARLLRSTTSEVKTITAWGERAGPEAQRDKFQKLLNHIRERLVGLVIIPDHHRLSRSVLDAETLFSAAADHGVLLHIGGRPYNPANSSDRYVLGVLAGHAQYENTNRARWIVGSKLKKAELCQMTIPLPSGLVWVSLEDPHYWTLAAEAGLGAWVNRRTTHQTRVPARRSNRRLVDAQGKPKHHDDEAGPRKVVMPFPDAALVRALALIVRWTLRDGSLPAVMKRIRRGDDQYPKPGRIPHVTGGWNYDPSAQVEWKAAAKGKLIAWLTSPALFGIYSVYMEALLPASKRRRRPKGTKGVHLARALSRREPPLPSALDLLPATGSIAALNISVVSPERVVEV